MTKFAMMKTYLVHNTDKDDVLTVYLVTTALSL